MKGELFIALAEGGNERRIVHRLGSGTVVCWALRVGMKGELFIAWVQ